MFRTHVLIIRRSKLYYTASGIITIIGGSLVHRSSVSSLNLCTRRPPIGDDDTRGCVMQFWPPDAEHMCSKHVEAWNKVIVKQNFCTSSWLNTEINILRCTVGKTSKFAISMLRESYLEITDFDSIIIHKNFDPKFTFNYSGCVVMLSCQLFINLSRFAL